MTDITPDTMLGLTTAERDAADRLELTPGVDLLLHYTEPAGWVASLIAPSGEQQTATGDDIGPFLLTAAETWANPII
ncbi:hypothetical protein [Nocardia terpenica]|uniref:Uncharacterized protein n=1 Tax=Nocardia terpenica TaxID=455432 RepID=A0A291RY47_9NOCA|nr:hypothetical protein [Nocardia terpenica]ATL72511.1 hypothetical protein CRH09_39760 [Nocardia terpenica]